MQYLSEEQINEVFSRFLRENPEPRTELSAVNPFTLLVSVVLSAQATDKSVNKATADLYKIADTPQKMLDLGEDALIGHIRTIGLYRAKAAHVMKLSAQLVEGYGAHSGGGSGIAPPAAGTFPRTREEFMALSGVGRKTANVMLNVLYGESVMPVDTHLLRIAPRMGLSADTKPEQVEADLLRAVPPQFLRHAHHWLILHGRYVCTAKKPQCGTCLLGDICPRNGVAAPNPKGGVEAAKEENHDRSA